MDGAQKKETLVFTNGCFDLIHPGHIYLLEKAKSLGTKLIVGLNSDRSVRNIKGEDRPFLAQEARATILRELRAVDEVIVFDENTPERLIKHLKPDVLVKGGDWAVSEIVGAKEVLERGGKVYSIPFADEFSSSKIASRIRATAAAAAAAASKKTPEPGLSAATPDGKIIERSLKSLIATLEKLLKNEEQAAAAAAAGGLISEASRAGKKIYVIGKNAGGINAEAAKKVLRRSLGKASKKFGAGDMILIFDDFEKDVSEISEALVEARRLGCQIIAVFSTAAGHSKYRKIGGLCDVAVRCETADESVSRAARAALWSAWCKVAEREIQFIELSTE